MWKVGGCGAAAEECRLASLWEHVLETLRLVQ
jgi:hypothetical protein